MPPDTHSELGASGAHRWLNCPGSVRLCKEAVKTTTVYASEGTAAAKLAEICLLNGKNTASYLGATIEADGKNHEVTLEMAENVQVYISVIREDLKSAGKGAELYVEKQFHLDWLYEGMYGRTDAMVAQHFGLLRVYDLKYGAGVGVEVEDNVQEMYYALGPVKEGAYDEVELVIVQPRFDHPDGPIRRCRMTPEELLRWSQEVLLPGAVATEDPAAPICLGEWCRFCDAMPICPAQKERAMTVAESVFQPTPKAPPEPSLMTPEELKKVLDVAPLVAAWFESCKKYTRTLLESGMADPKEIGYKIIAGRKSRSWKDEVDAEIVLKNLLGREAFEMKLRSPAGAEKLLTKEGKASLVPYIRVEQGTQVVPVKDKRPVITAAGEVFKEVDV